MGHDQLFRHPTGSSATIDVDGRAAAMDRAVLEALVDHAASLLVHLDGAGRIVAANRALSRLLDRDVRSEIGRPFVQLVVQEDREGWMRALARAGDTTEAMRLGLCGADGYVRRCLCSLTDLRTDQAVRGLVLSAVDVTDREDLRRQAETDPLTGLPNRRSAERTLRRRVEAGVPCTVLFCDLDDFKPVNDRWGHAAGDEVLRIVGQRLTSVLREDDLVGRLGGDEFVVIAAGTGLAGELVGRLREALAPPVAIPSATLQIGMSVGHADTESFSEVGALLRAADRAMYRNKAARHRR